jgi:hypothetical protein
MITLYHGTNVEILEIDLSLSKKGKDFGCGFYLNSNKQQAMDMANRTYKRLMKGSPIVNVYSFDDSVIETPGSLKIKIFDDYSIEWADFILKNRKNGGDEPIHPYDIVIGPIADDTVGVQIRRYVMGYISMENLIEELKFRGNRAVQYFFGTSRAISLLKKCPHE